MMELIVRLLAVIVLAALARKLASKLKMPAVLGFLIAGMAFGPHALNLLTQEILDHPAYHTLISFLECGIALATAPASALSIVTEYKTDDPVTKTLIPLAVIDDVIAICVFLSVMGVVLRQTAGGALPWYLIPLVVLFPILIGALTGTIAAAAVMNEIIAVFVARLGFRLAGEMGQGGVSTAVSAA